MTGTILPFPRRDGTNDQPPARLDAPGSSAVLDVLQERLAILAAEPGRSALPVPADARARAVRWAADMIIQVERLDDAAERQKVSAE